MLNVSVFYFAFFSIKIEENIFVFKIKVLYLHIENQKNIIPII